MAKHPALMKRKAPDANSTQPSTAPSPQQQRAAILASPTKASPTAKRSWSQPLGPLSKKRPPPQPLADSNTLKRPRPASPSSSSASSFEGDVVAEARAVAAAVREGRAHPERGVTQQPAPQQRTARLHRAARLQRRHKAAPDSPSREGFRQQSAPHPARTGGTRPVPGATPARSGAIPARRFAQPRAQRARRRGLRLGGPVPRRAR